MITWFKYYQIIIKIKWIKRGYYLHRLYCKDNVGGGGGQRLQYVGHMAHMGFAFSFSQVTSPKVATWETKEGMRVRWNYLRAVSNGRLGLLIVVNLRVLLLETWLVYQYYFTSHTCVQEFIITFLCFSNHNFNLMQAPKVLSRVRRLYKTGIGLTTGFTGYSYGYT
jgi:hypothetical protein